MFFATDRSAFGPLRGAVLGLVPLLFAAASLWAQQPREAKLFAIDGAGSRLTVLLAREGLFSAFAHDHVLVAREISGQVVLGGTAPGQARLRLTVPVRALVVDPPAARAEEGLQGTPSEAEKREIRANMLGKAQLDAARFPNIVVSWEGVRGEWPNLTLAVRVRIRGRQKIVPASITVGLEGNILTVEGEMALRQSDFGIEPFQLFLGTVAVRDEVRIKFTLRARRKN
ncbi:MAG: YceI family protein [bacterium]